MKFRNTQRVACLGVALAAALCPLANIRAQADAAPPETTAPPSSPAPGDAAAPAAVAPPAVPGPPGVAAEVNGDKIMSADVDRAVGWLSERNSALTTGSDAAKAALASLRENVLNNMITQRLLYQEALRANFKASEADVKAVLDDTKASAEIKTDEDYAAFLAKNGKTADDVHEDIRERLLIGQLTKQWMDNIVITDADAQKYFDDNKAGFVVPVTLSVQHILFMVKSDATPAERDQVHTHALAVLHRALANEDFAALAKAFSNDKSTRDDGGKIGLIAEQEKDEGLKPIAKAAFATPVGKVCQTLVESPFGYHVIKVDAKTPSHDVAFNDVKEFIKRALKEMRQRDKWDTEIAKLHAAAKIDTYAVATTPTP